MKQCLITALLIFLYIACSNVPSPWQTLDAGVFKLKTPSGWWLYNSYGSDVLMGGLTNGKDSLNFVLGATAAHFPLGDTTKQRYAGDTINGFSALVEIPKEDGDGFVLIKLVNVQGGNEFSLSGKDIEGTATVLEIFQSVSFKGSDPAPDKPLSFSDFHTPASPRAGKLVFQMNCASCHNVHKKLTGPPFREILEQRNADYIYRFLTDKPSRGKDSLRKAWLKECDGMECPDFHGGITAEDVQGLVEYAGVRP
ncbi:cytochrome c [Chitinophaga agrisoli]|uniref:Cytochrome c n=1 Tax=Chitinophaga agrisoli TaxID=2607653 RepID=A0A5B2W2U9_9BACT|nr:cytochrome c [Chitinophaga agrisoli]KAA2244826.1 cytochrome c [Chitinophaga agrisoli]